MAGAPTDLCELGDVISWLQSVNAAAPNSATEAQLQRLITAVSRQIPDWISSPLACMVYPNEMRNGTGQAGLSFKSPPVFAVNALYIYGSQVLPALSPIQSGYLFDKYQLYVVGWPSQVNQALYWAGPMRMWKGILDVQINYSAGYALPNQGTADWAAPVTAYAFGATIKPLLHNAGNFIFVASNAGTTGASEPTWNQTAGGLTTDGTVNWYNIGQTVLPEPLPVDITQAAIELVSFRYLSRNHIDSTSQHLADQSVTYTPMSAMTQAVRDMLQPYRQVAPIET